MYTQILIAVALVVVFVLLLQKRESMSPYWSFMDLLAEYTSDGGWNKAYSTWYQSYPDCCPKSPTYDPRADTTECTKYSGCKYLGKFAAGKRTYEQVKNENIVAFYSVAGQNGKKNRGMKWWNKNAKNKTVLLKRPDGSIMEAQVLDTCWDGDTSSGSACTKNANKGGGILIDLEKHTSARFWDGKPKNGVIEWRFK